MATDYYLQLDGIKGESTDSKHNAWIECTSVNWSITQPRSATASTGGGHTAERAELSEITVSKLEMLRADGAGEPIKYFEVELENVLIAHIAPSFGGGDFPGESLGLKFSKVRWKYTQQKIGGGSNGNTAGGWDLATNRIT